VEKLLEERPWQVRVAAAQALARLRPARADVAARTLGELLEDRDAVRWAAWALAKLGPAVEEAVPALTAALENPAGDCREAFLAALVAAGPKGAIAVPFLVADLDRGAGWLLGLAGYDPWNPSATIGVNPAFRALGRLGPAARDGVPALTLHLRDAEPAVRLE